MTTETDTWVCIGEIVVKGVGQLRAYLPVDPAQPGKADHTANRVSYSSVHPEMRPGVALVTGLDSEAPVWELCPDDWSGDAKQAAVDKALQLKRPAEKRA